MTKKRVKMALFAVVMALLVAFLFLTSSTDLILSEARTKVYQISCLVPDTDSADWTMFCKGLDVGAARFYADIAFVTLYEYENAPEAQRRSLGREIESGADALIVAGANAADMAQAVSALGGKVPIVGAAFALPQTDIAQITYDYTAASALLAEYLHAHAQSKVTMVCEKAASEQTRFASMAEAMESAGISVARAAPGSDASLSDWMRAQAKGSVLLAPTPTLLLRLAEARRAAARNDIVLVGIGNTPETLSALEAGDASALLCADELQAGYLCVQAAVKAAEGKKTASLALPFRLITRDTMFLEENTHLLFPTA